MTYCIIADFFREDFLRGSELATDALVELLRPNHKIILKRSHEVTPAFLQNNYRWIVSNRMNLSAEFKLELQTKKYIVIEHDAGWLSTRDFGLYEDFIPPADHIVNADFYRGAERVIMQSAVHEHAIKQALGLKNTVSSNGNPWSKADLELLRKLSTTQKTREFAIVGHTHPSKGIEDAVAHCEEKGHDYQIIPEGPRERFLTELSQYQFLVFLPRIFESYGRIAAEFRAMNGSLISNNHLGFTLESHSILGGAALIDFFEQNNKHILTLVE